MIEVHQTKEFSSWLRRLRDANAAARIVARIRRMEQGNPGDVRSVGSGVMEMRIDYGPGYRVYYMQFSCAPATSAHKRETSGGHKPWPVQ